MNLRMPRNTEAEMAALGSAILSPRARSEVFGIVTPGHFWLPAHREIAEALESLPRTAVDLVILRNALKERGKLAEVGGVQYLILVCESVASSANGAFYARIVRDRWQERELESRLEGSLSALRNGGAEGFRDAVSLASRALNGLQDSYGEVAAVGEVMDGMGAPRKFRPTSWGKLNQLEGGWPPGELSMVWAASGSGKSIALTQDCLTALRNLEPVAFVSLELSMEKQVERILKHMTGFFNLGQAARLGFEAEFLEKAAWLHNQHLTFIDNSGARLDAMPSAVETIAERLRSLHSLGKCQRVYLDHAQLVRSTDRRLTRPHEVGEWASLVLSNLAKTLKIPVIAASQCKWDDSEGEWFPQQCKQGWLNESALIVRIDRGTEGDEKKNHVAPHIHIRKSRHGAAAGKRIETWWSDSRWTRYDALGEVTPDPFED